MKKNTTRDWSKVSEGSRKSHTGTHLTQAHKRKISKGLKDHYKDDYVISATYSYDNGVQIIKTFNSAQECADYIGCSRQLISQCTRYGIGPNKNKSAKGWVIVKIVR